MKISYKHILDKIQQKPSIDELSAKLFQLGHEHEIENDIFNFEFTPNRGDCLSVYGILRELAVFYDVDLKLEKYTKDLKTLDINFKNKVPSACPRISFLRIEIDNEVENYNGALKDYFADLKINKNNFFTDVSNYISYETGQPTHCYDSLDTSNEIILDKINTNITFTTLFDDEIKLSGNNLVFIQNNKVINLAGVMGGKINSCSQQTRSVIIECAHFVPEEIIGKSIKYGIQSEAAHKFERNVDIGCHENVLRRFIKVVENHAKIKNLELYSKSFISNNSSKIDKDYTLINKILGTSMAPDVIDEYLLKLGFTISNKFIHVPSYRSDISTNNDIAEEVARIIGYDTIETEEFNMPIRSAPNRNSILNKVKEIFIDKGFYEVINNPFIGLNSINNDIASIKLDNPLDSNRAFMRQNLLDSLLNNLIYNERRQKDSLKFFEISDVYLLEPDTKKYKIEKRYGFIASGRVSKDHEGFSKKIDDIYLNKNLKMLIINKENLIEIPRDTLKTKNKNKIFYYEGNIEDLKGDVSEYSPLSSMPKDYAQYQEISEYPSSSRDLSLSIKNHNFIQIVYKTVEEMDIKNLKETFMFDFFNNSKNQEIKIGYRFIFQSNVKTLEDSEIDLEMNKIIKKFLSIDSVSIPGIKN